MVDTDHVDVRATQSIGPMTATFEAKVTVLERVPNRADPVPGRRQERAGRDRQCPGTVNAVPLRPEADATAVVVDGEVVLAGALGSVGQKIVAKQADKVTADFAENLQLALNGVGPGEAVVPPPAEVHELATVTGCRGRRRVDAGGSGARGAPGRPDADRWSRLAAALSAVSVVAERDRASSARGGRPDDHSRIRRTAGRSPAARSRGAERRS